jgi:hypothetical protein
MSPRAYETEEEAEAALRGSIIVEHERGPRLYEFQQVVDE